MLSSFPSYIFEFDLFETNKLSYFCFIYLFLLFILSVLFLLYLLYKLCFNNIIFYLSDTFSSIILVISFVVNDYWLILYIFFILYSFVGCYLWFGQKLWLVLTPLLFIKNYLLFITGLGKLNMKPNLLELSAVVLLASCSYIIL